MLNIKNSLSELNIIKNSNPATMAKLVNTALLTRWSKGTFLFMDRDEVDNIYFLVKGKLSLYKTSKSGDKKILFICEKGSAVNEEILCEKISSVNCEVTEDSHIISFQTQQFISIMENDFGLSKAMIDSLSMKVRRLYRQLKNTSNSIGSDRKIASRLWKIALDHQKNGTSKITENEEIVIPMTITCLADMLGLKRETASRQIKKLTSLGLLNHEKGKFYIKDCDALKDYYNQP